MPATVVGLSSLLEFVAISHEHSGHTQLYSDCPVEQLTFPIVRMDSPTSGRGPFPLPTADVGSAALVADVEGCAETLDIAIHFHQSPHSAITVFYYEQLQSPCQRVAA